VAYALIRIGDMAANLGRLDAALAHYERSRALRAADVKADPVNLWKRGSLIEAHAKITKTLARAGRREAALTQAAETNALMEKTPLEPTNAVFRSFFADTHTDVAEAHVALARHAVTPKPQAGAHWRAAREAYGRSLEIWQDLQQRGLITEIDRPKPDAVVRSIAMCDRALGAAEAARATRER
jgi:tetratricopeptide (TPR) repeat protein